MCRARSMFRVLPLLLAAIGYAHCVRYRDGPVGEMPLAVTRSCGEKVKWCEENWQADRVLEYVYNLTEKDNSTVQHSGDNFNCRGEQMSNLCEADGNTTANVSQYQFVRKLSSVAELNRDGIIVTDNYEPGNRSWTREKYRGNQDIIWQIRIPQNCSMKIVFEQFDLEWTENCDKDYFSVQIIKKQKDIRRYCDTGLLNITIQRRRKVQLWFHADDTIQRTGIYGLYCFSAIRRESPDDALRCDCNQVSTPTIRRRRSRPNGTPNMASQGALQSSQEAGMAGERLHDLIKRGERSVEEHRMDSPNPGKQLLAQRHQKIRDRLPSHVA